MKRIVLSVLFLLMLMVVFAPRIVATTGSVVHSVHPAAAAGAKSAPEVAQVLCGSGTCDCSCYSGWSWWLCAWGGGNGQGCCGGSMPPMPCPVQPNPSSDAKKGPPVQAKVCKPLKPYPAPIQSMLVFAGWRKS